MNNLPFNAYDFFGYLISGLVVLVALQLSFGYPQLLGAEHTFFEQLVALLAAYIVGQVAATPSKALLEDLLVRRFLGVPSTTLLEDRSNSLWAILFPGYFKPLPSNVRQRAAEHAREEGCTGGGEEIFLAARYSPATISNEVVMRRLDSFLNLYGFSRNLSFVFLLVGFIGTVTVAVSPEVDQRLWLYTTGCLVLGIGLFYRFLKFYRQYSYELFAAYAHGLARTKQEGKR